MATVPADAEVLWEQEGLTIHRNARNRMTVVTLRYSADPAKRSPEWAAEARAGMTDAQWAKEYEIDATALFGEKVFPEIATNRARIVVEEPCPEVPTNAPCWGGFDYGSRNPSSFHVYTIIDGVTFSVWELFEPCKNVTEFSTKLKACPYWNQIRYIACDPTILNQKTQQTRNGIVTLGSLFIEEGIHKFIGGNRDEAVWVAKMREHWKNAEDPTFRIYATCPNQIREFESAVFVSMSERQMAQGNQYAEEILGKNNHSLDDCKYFMNSLPTGPTSKVKVPSMVRRWLK